MVIVTKDGLIKLQSTKTNINRYMLTQDTAVQHHYYIFKQQAKEAHNVKSNSD